jgi:hypothetical protein
MPKPEGALGRRQQLHSPKQAAGFQSWRSQLTAPSRRHLVRVTFRPIGLRQHVVDHLEATHSYDGEGIIQPPRTFPA